MSESREKPVKSWDDVRHAFDVILKRPLAGFEWHKSLAPRYIDGGMSIHLHTVVKFAGVRQGVCWECRGDGNRSDVGGYDYRKTMLIRVFREIEEPERLIPSLVRLNRLDFIKGTCGKDGLSLPNGGPTSSRPA